MKHITILIFLLSVSGLFAQMNVQLVGHLDPIPGNQKHYSDIWGYTDSNGREYAIMDGFLGTYFIDLGDPTNPQVVQFIEGPPSIWRDMKTHSHYAYIVTEGEGQGEGLQIVDLSGLPDSVRLVKNVTDYFTKAHNIFIENGYAFVIGTAGGGGMHILDLSDPENPTQTAYYSESGYIHDVYAWGDSVIVASEAEYALVDISDKANPKKVSESVRLPGYSHSGWMTEDKRYFYGTDEFNQRDITIFDLQDRSNWEIVNYSWQFPSNTYIHNIFIKGNYAHISYYQSGYVVLDITDPTTPYLVGHYDTYPDETTQYSGAWGCYPYFESGLTIISDTYTGLYVLKFNPADPQPFIQNVEVPEYVTNTDDYKVTTKMMDNSGLVKQNLFYITEKEGVTSSWTKLEPTSVVDDEFEFTIPGQPSKTRVGFYFAAADDSGNVVTLPFGGTADDPPANVHPPDLYSYRVLLAGPPVLLSLSPMFQDTTITKGESIRFEAEFTDSTDLEVTYGWYKNGVKRATARVFNFTSTVGVTPRTDTLKMIVSNGFFEYEKIWSISVEEPVSVNDYRSELSYNLKQNYPNPFNPATTLSFSIKESGFVKLEVYNLIGQKVATLVEENLTAGKYQRNFDASGLSNGIYLARLITPAYSKTIKMSLIK